MSCSSCGASDGAICPCGTRVHPRVIFNTPGQAAIDYRSGAYADFRHALLRALPGEAELTQTIGGQTIQVWRPGAEGDLAVQMMEWWAYLADVLSFYNERIANEAYLGTAVLSPSVNRLIKLLGYRPRPGLGAHATLAARLSGTKAVTLPEGFKVQSKPGPGQTPQIFELGAAVTLTAPDVVAGRTVPLASPLLSADGRTVWLAGAVSGIKPGERLLLLNAGAVTGGDIAAFAWATVSKTDPASDLYGDAVTAVTFTSAVTALPAGAQAADFALMRAGRSAQLWSSRPAGWTTPVIGASSLDLASVERGLSAGALTLVETRVDAYRAPVTELPVSMARIIALATVLVSALVRVSAYSEVIWFANGNGASPPGGDAALPIPVLHSHLQVQPALPDGWDAYAAAATVRFGFASLGRLVGMPSAAEAAAGEGAQILGATPFPAGVGVQVLLQDDQGGGASSTGAVSADQRLMTLGPLAPASPGLAPRVEALFDLFTVTRGETVANEALGTGDAAVASQDFTLKKAPVTYFADPDSRSGDQFSSTVRVWVDGLEWAEVPFFFGQPPKAQVFVTREDEADKTHVVFGDGLAGALLPTGASIVATYRTGSGAASPAAGALTNSLQPQPGLKSLANPVAAVGGADPDPPAKIRALAPRSVLTFGRAISLDDYQVIAAGAPGVVQATAAYAFDPLSQRPAVTVWVRGDGGAVAAVQAAFAGEADPNRPVRVLAATPLETWISLTYVRDPRRQDATVRSALQGALLDPDKGLLGQGILGIGEALYDSQVFAACLAVAGVTAVEVLSVRTGPRFRPLIRFGPIFRGRRPAAAGPGCASERHDPGQGRYLWVPDDGEHLVLGGETSP